MVRWLSAVDSKAMLKSRAAPSAIAGIRAGDLRLPTSHVCGVLSTSRRMIKPMRAISNRRGVASADFRYHAIVRRSLLRIITAIQLTRLTMAFGAVADVWFV